MVVRIAAVSTAATVVPVVSKRDQKDLAKWPSKNSPLPRLAVRSEREERSDFVARQPALIGQEHHQLIAVPEVTAIAEQWVLNTIGVLRYGAQAFRGAVVSRGEEFYLQTPAQISEELATALTDIGHAPQQQETPT